MLSASTGAICKGSSSLTASSVLNASPNSIGSTWTAGLGGKVHKRVHGNRQMHVDRVLPGAVILALLLTCLPASSSWEPHQVSTSPRDRSAAAAHWTRGSASRPSRKALLQVETQSSAAAAPPWNPQDGSLRGKVHLDTLACDWT